MKDWEKEFDELIYKISDRGFDGKRSPVLYGDSFNEIKQFISGLLATQKSEIIKKYGHFNDGCGCCMDKTLKQELRGAVGTAHKGAIGNA